MSKYKILAGHTWRNSQYGEYTRKQGLCELFIGTAAYHPDQLYWSAWLFQDERKDTWSTGTTRWSMTPDGSLYDAALERCAKEAIGAAQRLELDVVST